jgi:hypothetical protein
MSGGTKIKTRNMKERNAQSVEVTQAPSDMKGYSIDCKNYWRIQLRKNQRKLQK